MNTNWLIKVIKAINYIEEGVRVQEDGRMLEMSVRLATAGVLARI